MTDWKCIVDEYGPVVFRIASRILGQHQDAEDVAQDVFCEVYQLHAKTSVDNWPALLRRMATLRSIDQLRRRRRAVSLEAAQFADTRGDPLDRVVAGELANRLRQAITDLPEQQAAVFSLRYFEGLSNSEIACSLRISLSAVSTALSKARSTLNTQLVHLIPGGKL